jgi:transposase InsO family protein
MRRIRPGHRRTRAEARSAAVALVEVFYNTHRRHSALGALSPADDERRWQHAAVG